MFGWEEGRRAVQLNPDLGLSGVDKVGCLFMHVGPLRSGASPVYWELLF